MKGQTSAAAVKRLEHELSNHILSCPEGAYLGSEKDLIAKFETGRSTFRQAARLVEHQQLLHIRKGPNGGFFGMRPDVDATVKSAALYLQLRRLTLVDVLHATRSLGMDAARFAADTEHRKKERLSTARDALIAVDEGEISIEQFLKLEWSLIEEIIGLADNAALELFLKMSYRFGWTETTSRMFENRADRIKIMREGRVKLATAVLDGEAEIAALHFGRQCDQMIEWL